MERVGRRESFPCIFLIVAFIFTSNQQDERAIFCIVDSVRYAYEALVSPAVRQCAPRA